MLKAAVDLNSIRDNFLFLRKKTQSRIMAVVKADAYGHGLKEVSISLASAGAETFGVGTVREGLLLRNCLDRVHIYSLLGPMEEEDYQIIRSRRIIPFIHSWEQLKALSEFSRTCTEKIPVALKLETGMNRLGFRGSDLEMLLELWNNCQGLELDMLASHLALTDDPMKQDKVKKQLEIFMKYCRAFANKGLEFKKSIANSAALIDCPETHLDMVRPGIALYGDNPVRSSSLRSKGQGLVQAMHITAPVLAVHELKAGEGVSYGLCFTAPKDMRIAVIGCGYAHNYSRMLSNRGWMFYQGERLPVLGRVCMQLTVLDATCVPGISAGEKVHVLGGSGENSISAGDTARWWGTVAYEVFCLLGRNPREYIRRG